MNSFFRRRELVHNTVHVVDQLTRGGALANWGAGRSRLSPPLRADTEFLLPLWDAQPHCSSLTLVTLPRRRISHLRRSRPVPVALKPAAEAAALMASHLVSRPHRHSLAPMATQLMPAAVLPRVYNNGETSNAPSRPRRRKWCRARDGRGGGACARRRWRRSDVELSTIGAHLLRS
jgi:hypothetical protein